MRGLMRVGENLTSKPRETHSCTLEVWARSHTIFKKDIREGAPLRSSHKNLVEGLFKRGNEIKIAKTLSWIFNKLITLIHNHNQDDKRPFIQITMHSFKFYRYSSIKRRLSTSQRPSSSRSTNIHPREEYYPHQPNPLRGRPTKSSIAKIKKQQKISDLLRDFSLNTTIRKRDEVNLYL